jgi:hypothetical protein
MVGQCGAVRKPVLPAGNDLLARLQPLCHDRDAILDRGIGQPTTAAAAIAAAATTAAM